MDLLTAPYEVWKLLRHQDAHGNSLLTENTIRNRGTTYPDQNEDTMDCPERNQHLKREEDDNGQQAEKGGENNEKKKTKNDNNTSADDCRALNTQQRHPRQPPYSMIMPRTRSDDSVTAAAAATCPIKAQRHTDLEQLLQDTATIQHRYECDSSASASAFPSGSIVHRLWRCYRLPLLLSAVLHLGGLAGTVSASYALHEFLEWTMAYAKDIQVMPSNNIVGQQQGNPSTGYLLAVLIGGLLLLGVLCEKMAVVTSQKVFFRMRCALTVLVGEHLGQATTEALEASDPPAAARAATLLDTELPQLPSIGGKHLHLFWSTPLLAATITYILHRWLSWAGTMVLPAIALSYVYILPAALYEGRASAAVRELSVKRSAFTTAVMDAMRTIRGNAWVDAMLRRVLRLREAEEIALRRLTVARGLLLGSTTLFSVLAEFIFIVIVFYTPSLRHLLTPGNIFPAVILAAYLRSVCIFVPLSALHVVTLKRIFGEVDMLLMLPTSKKSEKRPREEESVASTSKSPDAVMTAIEMAADASKRDTYSYYDSEECCYEITQSTSPKTANTDGEQHITKDEGNVLSAGATTKDVDCGITEGRPVPGATVNVSIPRHSIVVVCGPTGCGKSAFLRMLAGEDVSRYYTPAGGAVAAANRTAAAVAEEEVANVENGAESDLSISVEAKGKDPPTVRAFGKSVFVAQDGFVFDGTMSENITAVPADDEEAAFGAVPGAPLETVDDERLRNVMDLSSIDPAKFTATSPISSASLSGGERLRVSLARVLYSDADIVLLDEPVSALDPDIAEDFIADVLVPLRQLHARSFVVATNHPTILQQAADYIIDLSIRPLRCRETAQRTQNTLLQDGRLMQNPSSEETREEGSPTNEAACSKEKDTSGPQSRKNLYRHAHNNAPDNERLYPVKAPGDASKALESNGDACGGSESITLEGRDLSILQAGTFFHGMWSLARIRPLATIAVFASFILSRGTSYLGQRAIGDLVAQAKFFGEYDETSTPVAFSRENLLQIYASMMSVQAVFTVLAIIPIGYIVSGHQAHLFRKILSAVSVVGDAAHQQRMRDGHLINALTARIGIADGVLFPLSLTFVFAFYVLFNSFLLLFSIPIASVGIAILFMIALVMGTIFAKANTALGQHTDREKARTTRLVSSIATMRLFEVRAHGLTKFVHRRVANQLVKSVQHERAAEVWTRFAELITDVAVCLMAATFFLYAIFDLSGQDTSHPVSVANGTNSLSRAPSPSTTGSLSAVTAAVRNDALEAYLSRLYSACFGAFVMKIVLSPLVLELTTLGGVARAISTVLRLAEHLSKPAHRDPMLITMTDASPPSTPVGDAGHNGDTEMNKSTYQKKNTRDQPTTYISTNTALPTGLVIRNLLMRYGQGPLVLRGLGLEAPAGSLTFLRGPSGCGKSSLFLALLGLYPVERGSDVHAFSVRLGAPGWRRLFTWVPQEAFLFAGTVLENLFPEELQEEQTDESTIQSSSDVLRDVERRALAQRALALTGLGESATCTLDAVVSARGENFSGGERQRLGIARALAAVLAAPAGTPRVLLMDEPTSHIEPAACVAILRAIKQAACVERGVAALVISHQNTEALQVADHCITLMNGTTTKLH